MKYNYILILSIILIIGACTTKINRPNSECKEYMVLLKSEWKFDNSTATYYFKGKPEYWYEPKYIVESCLVGKNKREIIKIFGKPSKNFIFTNFEYLIYCIDNSCLDTFKEKGKRISFFLNAEGNVEAIYVTPPSQKNRITTHKIWQARL